MSSFESAMSGPELSPDSNFKTKEPMTNNKEEVQPANNNNIEDDDTASMSDKVNLPNVKKSSLSQNRKRAPSLKLKLHLLQSRSPQQWDTKSTAGG